MEHYSFPSTQNGCSIEHEMGEAGKEAETIYEEHKSIAYVHPWTMGVCIKRFTPSKHSPVV
jgi:hypothetical protein